LIPALDRQQAWQESGLLAGLVRARTFKKSLRDYSWRWIEMVAGLRIELSTSEVMSLACSRYTCPQWFGAEGANRTLALLFTREHSRHGHQPMCPCGRFCGHQSHVQMLTEIVLAKQFNCLSG